MMVLPLPDDYMLPLSPCCRNSDLLHRRGIELLEANLKSALNLTISRMFKFQVAESHIRNTILPSSKLLSATTSYLHSILAAITTQN